ncbi:DUF6431 domain-containing protein [Paenibacillus senegalensis]|uniref:DUF6431 domain-containing protein n=1 Tax=Paenibacillus senegalensis TaxID=1465766 RepID=UPI0009DB384E|nr:DUF6431 domain-containing protein [Paenibacillus senegalensis]
MSWLRRTPAFFVRCTEVVPSPCCGEKLKIIGSKERKLIKDCGERLTLIVRRMRCSQCYKIHHELPDCIVPYKRYESSCVEQAITKTKNLEVAVPAHESTLHRWRSWFHAQSAYWLGCLTSIAIRYLEDPVERPSNASQSVHHTLGHVVGDAPGWLATIVRSVANENLWVHTRSAFLSD